MLSSRHLVLENTKHYTTEALLLSLLKQCSSTKTLQQVHTQMVIHSIHKPNHLLSQSIHLKNFSYTSLIFSHISPHPNDYAFNIMLRALTTTWHNYPLTLQLYHQMKSFNLTLSNFTFPFLFLACASLADIQQGRSAHSTVFKLGLESDHHTAHSLITMYARCGKLGYARKVFDEIAKKDLVSWNSMISGYAKMGYAREAVEVFGRLREEEGFEPDEMSLVSVLGACGELGNLELGKWVEGFVVERDMSLNSYIGSALISMYAKCGDLASARRIFDCMPNRDAITWNAVISGYSQNGMADEAISLFHDMKENCVNPNKITLTAVLSACACIGALDLGKQIDEYATQRGFQHDIFVATALVDMYAKCGSLESAERVFKDMPRKNDVSWNAMISALASHGKAKEALSLFQRMSDEGGGARPNDITFVALLSACVHAGLVAEGYRLFDMMSTLFGLVPKIEHYSCMVDLLARAGQLYEAWDLIEKMPEKPDKVTLGALHGACRRKKNVDIGERVMQMLLKLDPSNSGNYIISSKVYANANMWDDSARMRALMREKGVTKTPGCSWIEIENHLHEFRAGDGLSLDSTDICNMKIRDILVNLLETCCNDISISQLHSKFLKLGVVHDSFIVTKLNVLYAKHVSIHHAHKLFEETPHKSIYLWNALLRSYCSEREWVETLSLFYQMNASAMTTEERPDSHTVSIALKSCAGLRKLHLGKMIHGFLKKRKLDDDMFVGSSLIDLYSKCGQMNDAVKVFMEYQKPDVVLWTSIVTGYEQNGSPELALAFFSRMVVSEHVSPDPVTLVSAASACAQLSDFKLGRSVHGFVKRRGLDTKLCLANSLLNIYGKTGSIKSAESLFREMPEKDVISWSSMVACYADNGAETNALDLFNEMLYKRIKPNWVTMVSALRACACISNLEEGKKIHELAVNYGFELETTVSTTLMDMYMKCFSPENAVDIFNRMPKKDVIAWAVLFSGYAEIGMAHKSMGVFCNMLSSGTRPDAIALVKILAAISELGILQQAVCLHTFVIKSGFENNQFIGASLIELYAKCSSIDDAYRVFKGMTYKDVVTWSSIIAAYGFHGQGEEALKLFYQMANHSDTKPNDVTFISILSACSHSGLIKEGIKMFDIMVNKYQLIPNSEHYGIMVDLLGRMGELDKALDIITDMPIQVGPHIWGALLGACRIHQNIEIGEAVAKNLFRLAPNHAGYYILLSNIYSVEQNWHNAAKLRTLVKENRLKKIVGQSIVELKNEVRTFVAGDRFHDESDQIYEMLRKLHAKMKGDGYEPQLQIEKVL